MTTLLVGWMTSAWPCGGVVHGEDSIAESDGIEVLFEPGADEVAVSYAVAWRGDATDLGWVIPVPGDVVAVEDGDADRFEELRQLSDPYVEYVGEEGSSAGCACGGGSKSGGDRSLDGGTRGDAQNALTVLSQGFTGDYEYAVIAASDAADLDLWFEENGWTGLATEDLEHYIAAGATFAALKVLPEDLTGDARLLPPIRIRYTGQEMSFPAVMARHGVPEHRATLYVVADTRAALAGDWEQDDTTVLYGVPDNSPTDLWLEHLALVGRDQKYARTAAGPMDSGGFLTRFDTLAPRDVLDADPVLTLEDSTESVSVRIVIGEGVPPSQAALPLSVLWLAWLGRRRRSA